MFLVIGRYDVGSLSVGEGESPEVAYLGLCYSGGYWAPKEGKQAERKRLFVASSHWTRATRMESRRGECRKPITPHVVATTLACFTCQTRKKSLLRSLQ